MKRAVLGLALAFSAGACTYPVTAVPTSLAAAEVAPNRRLNFPVSYSIGPDFSALDVRTRSVTFAGSAHTYDIRLSAPFAQTLQRTLSAAYTTAILSPNPGAAPHHYRFDIEDSIIEVAFLDRFLTVASAAYVSITLRVRVFGPNWNELTRALAQGSGRVTLDGGLGTMPTAIQQAAERAMRTTATDFVYKVINAGTLPNRP